MGANGYGIVLGDLLAKRYRENPVKDVTLQEAYCTCPKPS